MGFNSAFKGLSVSDLSPTQRIIGFTEKKLLTIFQSRAYKGDAPNQLLQTDAQGEPFICRPTPPPLSN